MKMGQRIALERLARACGSEGRCSVLIFKKHATPAQEPIRLAESRVGECFVDGKPYPARSRALREVLDELVARYAPKRVRPKTLRTDESARARQALTDKRAR